ncbi:twin-arginine translocation signal domain-containing protein [Arthrobacter mangrovi]
MERRAFLAFAVGAVGVGALLPGDLGAVPDKEA